jgi:hypothetical protein
VNGKYLYAVLRSNAIKTKNTAGATIDSSIFVNQNFLLVPMIVHDLKCTIGTTERIITREDFMKAFTNFNKIDIQAGKNILIANNETIIGVFQTSLNPMLVLNSTEKPFNFLQPINADGSNTVPIFLSRIDS